MFKSREVAYLKPSSFNNKSCILGIGNGLRLIRLFSSLKSEIKRTVPFFFGIINVGAAHSELFIRFKTPILTSRSTSFFKVSSCIRGIGKGLA